MGEIWRRRAMRDWTLRDVAVAFAASYWEGVRHIVADDHPSAPVQPGDGTYVWRMVGGYATYRAHWDDRDAVVQRVG